jgi:hypothetical protein
MGVVALLVVAAGFTRSVHGAVTGSAPLTPLVHLHAAVFLAWVVLYLVQTTLVATSRTAVHRRLGYAAVGLAVMMVGVGYQTAVVAARRGYDPVFEGPRDPLGNLVHTLGDVLSFTVLVALGLGYRRRPEVHKRLMLLATVGPMLNAPLIHFYLGLPGLPGRLPMFLASMAALLFTGAVYDRLTLGRFHPVTLWGAVVLFAWANVRAGLIGPSVAWHRFAEWLVA